jgi:colicin import membrane protein
VKEIKKTPDTVYHRALALAVLVHIGVLSVLVFNFEKHSVLPVVKKAPKILNAVALNSAEVQSALKGLKEFRAKKSRDLKAEQKKLKTAVKQEALALKDAKEEANHKMLAIKKQQALAKADLAKQKHTLQESQKKLEDSKAALEKTRKKLLAQAEKEKKLLEKKNRERLAEAKRQEELKRVEQQRIASLREAQVQGLVDRYKAMILQAISQHWFWPPTTNKNAITQLRIRLGPEGDVLAVTVTKTSGSASLDRSAVAAVYKTTPLPIPSDPSAAERFRQFDLSMRPEHLMTGHS